MLCLLPTAHYFEAIVLQLAWLLHFTTSSIKLQGAYKSGKPGNIREFCNSGKLREFEMYSGNFWSPLLSVTKM